MLKVLKRKHDGYNSYLNYICKENPEWMRHYKLDDFGINFNGVAHHYEAHEAYLKIEKREKKDKGLKKIRRQKELLDAYSKLNPDAKPDLDQIKTFLAGYYLSKDITYRKTSFDTHVQILLRKFHPVWFRAVLESRMDEDLLLYMPHEHKQIEFNKLYNDEKYAFESDSEPETPEDRNPVTNGAVAYHLIDVQHGETPINDLSDD